MLAGQASVITQAISPPHCLWVVVRQHDRVGGHRAGDAGRIGQPERSDTRAGRGEQRVDVPVITAGELHNKPTAGVAARQPQRRHGGLGPRVHQPHLVDRRAGDYFFGKLYLAGRHRAERRAMANRLTQRLRDGWMRVAEYHRPP
jgi:hypothetical protein